MPKVTIEFNLPEEEHEYNIYTCAQKMYNFIDEFSSYLRNELKYTEMTPEGYIKAEQIRERFHALKHDNGVTLE